MLVLGVSFEDTSLHLGKTMEGQDAPKWEPIPCSEEEVDQLISNQVLPQFKFVLHYESCCWCRLRVGFMKKTPLRAKSGAGEGGDRVSPITSALAIAQPKVSSMLTQGVL